MPPVGQAKNSNEALLHRSWDALCEAVGNPDHAWNRVVVGSTSEEGSEIRTAILRRACFESRRLWIHTDSRSPKVGQWQTDPRSAWLFYDHATRTQLIVKGLVRIIRSGGDWQRDWDETPSGSRINYQGLQEPGRPLNPGEEVQPLSQTSGQENFAVIELTIRSIDRLQLDRRGNRRIRYVHDESGWQAIPVAP